MKAEGKEANVKAEGREGRKRGRKKREKEGGRRGRGEANVKAEGKCEDRGESDIDIPSPSLLPFSLLRAIFSLPPPSSPLPSLVLWF